MNKKSIKMYNFCPIINRLLTTGTERVKKNVILVVKDHTFHGNYFKII